MDFDVKNIFFEALEYPQYVRPFFFIKKQQESGWHKAIFLKGLQETFFGYEEYLDIKLNASKGKNPNLKIEDISISIEKETAGKHRGELTKMALNELEVAILNAYEIDKPERKFSDVEILTFFEYSLWFIRNEFQIQIGDKEYKWFRPRTKTYFVYQIISEAPFLDFPKFKNAVLSLLLNGQNYPALKKLLEKYYKAALEIVEIWNEKLFNLESKFNSREEKDLPETVKLEFKEETLNHSWWNDSALFDIKRPQRYSNQNLASLAVNVVNFLSQEVLKKNSTEIEVGQKDFVKDFLEGIHEMRNNRILSKHLASLKIKNGQKDEAPFRDFFKVWFKARGYHVEIEAPKDNGRIDLRVSHSAVGNKIIEFKGWWNNKKNVIVSQVSNYLTEFEADGYIFLIDNTQSGIVNKYRDKIITIEPSSINKLKWEAMTYYPTSYKYYQSCHMVNRTQKSIYHFIFSIWQNETLLKKNDIKEKRNG